MSFDNFYESYCQKKEFRNAILRAAVVEMGGGGEGGIPDPIVDLLSTNSDVGGN